MLYKLQNFGIKVLNPFYLVSVELEKRLYDVAHFALEGSLRRNGITFLSVHRIERKLAKACQVHKTCKYELYGGSGYKVVPLFLAW